MLFQTPEIAPLDSAGNSNDDGNLNTIESPGTKFVNVQLIGKLVIVSFMQAPTYHGVNVISDGVGGVAGTVTGGGLG